MKPNKDIKDELLGRWLAGELNDDERAEFEASESFQTYKTIVQYTDDMELSSYDSEAEYAKVKAKIDQKKKAKVVKMPRYRKWAIAAGVLILMGIGSLFMFDYGAVQVTNVATINGETKTIKLPDNSTIEMNVTTQVAYNKGTWNKNRDVELKGEAFFKVKKGKPFRVITDNGTIEVLGTSFNIRDRNELTEIVCYTGKVRVTDTKGHEVILTKNMAARINDGTLVKNWTPPVSDSPSWKSNSSSFHLAPLSNVIKEIELQYDVTVKCDQDISGRTYVGSFPHDNLDQALQLVFDPMQLDYAKESDAVIVVK